jgi:hypothetical protein
LPALIILLLVAAGVFIGLAMLGRTGGETPVVGKNATPQTESVPVPITMSHPPVVAAAVTAPADPPASTEPRSPMPPALKLQGIVYDSKRWLAIVDGQTIRVGDPVGNFRVKDISRNAVTLQEANGTQKKLVLGK